MKTEWNLDILYTGFDDPSYEEDMKLLQELSEKKHSLAEKATPNPDTKQVEEILLLFEENNRVLTNLYDYVGLRQSVDTEDGEAMAQEARIMRLYSEGAADSAALEKILGSIEDIDALAKESKLIEEYKFFLNEEKKALSHLLGNDVEAMIASMQMTGSSAWGSLQTFLTSTVKVDYDGKQLTLSEIRNLAYSSDAKVRKAAYEAELACYEKIQDAVAFSLNNIKNETTMLAKKRNYGTALDMTLENSRMSRETLDSMMEAVQEYLPVFRKYLRKKAELLGYKNGLPFFELFAPLGTDDKKYSLEEANDVLQEAFRPLAPDMADMMKEAFENEWIDFYPRNGKQGGAFCAGLPQYKQSRILTNYDGTFGAIDTLAHELGHAFHNRQMENERLLNLDYPMPVAETASTFNEVHLGAFALKNASPEEKLALLESDLKEKTQCIVDIYSRYLFETEVFEKCQEKFLMAKDLKEMMLDAQTKSYGDGLDPEFMHPYMWVCKSHYYGSTSFYNFPYTFGNLFAQGLYALYLEEGESFIPKYKEMLRLTGTSSIEEDGARLGIDLTKKEFWVKSLQLMADEIEEFCSLA